jgi:K+-sensing histidine kinase KdpD
MGILQNLFSGGASTLIDSVGKVLDNVVTTKEEKMQLDNEIRKSEMQFQVDMKKLSNEEQQMMLADISSARQREVQVLNAPNVSWWTKNTMHVMALGTIVITLALFYVLIFTKDLINDSKKEIILYILGVLSATLTQIYSYYFGSSAGSAAKSETLAKITERQ